MPQLLCRLYLEVTNGGFGPWEVVSLTGTGDWFSNCADMAEAYRDFTDADTPLPPGIVPDADLCCSEHALASLGLSPTPWLTGRLRGGVPGETCPS
ncbi:hypothetical protein PV367_27530 [Streptomyces europaeiscabiei]|uniref:Uncharacterized protein n=1 Tax=Streptomyces europaeiscabiei TaxID=146819 RepID=A0AAJ2PU78_9ACTN|nr:hypothetical protein [Streptomyces europaeiscabiei]MDX3133449.1 hypothetical protein [Streptomyces europaeiscabiei]